MTLENARLQRMQLEWMFIQGVYLESLKMCLVCLVQLPKAFDVESADQFTLYIILTVAMILVVPVRLQAGLLR